MIEIKRGDKLQLKKAHPCGSHEWEVVRTGADIGIRCLKCHRRVVLERSLLERRVRGVRRSQSEGRSLDPAL